MDRAMFGIPYGRKTGDDPETRISVSALEFAAGQAELFYTSPTGLDGSAANFYGWQTLFVDNSGNDYPLDIIWTGTLFGERIPARSQGFVPVACPESTFSFRALCANPSAIRIPIALWSTDIGPSIWATQSPTGSSTPVYAGTVERNQIPVGTTSVTVVQASTLATNKTLKVKNTGTTNVYISLGTATVSATNGFLLAAGQSETFEGPFSPANGLRAISDAAGGQLSYITY